MGERVLMSGCGRTRVASVQINLPVLPFIFSTAVRVVRFNRNSIRVDFVPCYAAVMAKPLIAVVVRILMGKIAQMVVFEAHFECFVFFVRVEGVGATLAIVARVVSIVYTAQVVRASLKCDLRKRGDQKQHQSAGIGEQPFLRK